MPRKQSSSSRGRRSGSTSRGSSSSQGSRSTSGHGVSRTTSDHDEIREWAEQRGAVPACVQSTGDPEDTGMICLEFLDAPNRPDENLEEIDWDEFFEKFDDADLAMVYQETTAEGEQSNFYKLVKREAAKSAGAGR